MLTQGDKWMRLPSVAFDSKDLIRSLSIADGPEEIIDAEEYLHPQEPDVVDSPQNKVGGIPSTFFFFSVLRRRSKHCWVCLTPSYGLVVKGSFTIIDICESVHSVRFLMTHSPSAYSKILIFQSQNY